MFWRHTYRDQTWMFALGVMSIQEFFAQMYAHSDVNADPATGGRSMKSILLHATSPPMAHGATKRKCITSQQTFHLPHRKCRAQSGWHTRPYRIEICHHFMSSLASHIMVMKSLLRPWAIQNGILGEPFTNVTMYKRVGISAHINTYRRMWVVSNLCYLTKTKGHNNKLWSFKQRAQDLNLRP